MLKTSVVLAALAMALAGAARADGSISNKPTQNMSCSAGVCTATAKGANLNVADLTTMLASGDTTVKTGGGAITIQVLDGFSWTTTSRLTLDANHSIGIHQPVVVAGTGALTIFYNDGGSDGDLKFFDTGKIDFWDTVSNLIIDRKSYFLVSTLTALADAVTANPTARYALTSDLDAGPNGTYRNSPIRTHVRGTIEGLGHAIENLEIRSRDQRYVGLFRQLRGRGTIRDLAVIGAKIISTAEFAGILVGLNDGEIRNSYVAGRNSGGSAVGGGIGGLAASNGPAARIIGSTASVSLNSIGKYTDAGGLVAENKGAILDSSAFGAVGGSFAGGLVGDNDGSIVGCRSNVGVSDTLGTSDGRVAGLVAINYGSIMNSYATGMVQATSTDEHAGGLVGLNNGGTISSSFATGSVSAGEYVGGLVGRGNGEIDNSYALGSVQGSQRAIAGGLIGLWSGGPVNFSFSTGAVSAEGSDEVGGFVGAAGTDNQNDYWDLDTSGLSNGCGAGPCSGITGLTDSQLKSGLPNGFDPNIWGLNSNINSGYPYLLANPPQ